jgi:hypothetical protein
MAVEDVKSDLYRDQLTGGAIPQAQKAHGRIHMVTGTVSHDAAASSGSTYKLGEVPSAAMVHPDTIFEAGNWNFTDMRIGTKDDVSALVSALVSAGNQSPVAALDANHGKAWWEVLGLAADPGGMITIYAHAIGAASAAGSMKFNLVSIDN